MNLIPTIREALGLQENEEFNIKNEQNVVLPDKFRFTYRTFQIEESERWIEAHSMMLKLLLKGECEVVKKPWRPKKNEEYYCVDADKNIDMFPFDISSSWDLISYSYGNCFRTKEEITPEILEGTWQKCYGAYFQDDKQDGAQQ